MSLAGRDVSVFAGASVIMLSMSGVYHMLTDGGAGSAVLFRLDKAAIFVLIAAHDHPPRVRSPRAVAHRGHRRAWSALAIRRRACP